MHTGPVKSILQNAYIPEGGNEEGREASQTSISMIDSYDMKTLLFKFGRAGINI